MNIFASMPGDAIYDSAGKGRGSYFVEALDKILRDEKWGKEDLDSIILRMRRGIGEETCAKEWVHLESAHSKKKSFSEKMKAS